MSDLEKNVSGHTLHLKDEMQIFPENVGHRV